MTISIYGIKNCDTMKKAWTWLGDHKIAYVFHDYRVDGIDRKQLQAWSKTVGWQVLLNKASTTFKDLPDEAKQDLDEAKAISLMFAQPTMIKRPVLDLGNGKLLVGFKPDLYAGALKG